MCVDNNLGEFLREKRKEKGLTQKQLSNLLHVTESAVSKWEKGVAHPDISLLTNLSEILGVTEHELITASVDQKTRQEKVQAKKWRAVSFAWSLFFYIAYGLTLITCFICNLAIDKTLSWFWIVLSALVLAFTFTNLPKFIKSYKLFLIPLSNFLALVLLLGVVCLYSNGNWFWIATISVLLGITIIFLPIFIAKYPLFTRIKRFNDFISVGIDFVLLNVLLIIIDGYCINQSFANESWYLSIALPITLCVYLAVSLLMCVRFLKVNNLIKTSVILTLTTFILYGAPLFIKSDDPVVQNALNEINIFKANLAVWKANATIQQNVHLLICLTLITTAVAFFIAGVIKRIKTKKS